MFSEMSAMIGEPLAVDPQRQHGDGALGERPVAALTILFLQDKERNVTTI